jgi:hypothetical protein
VHRLRTISLHSLLLDQPIGAAEPLCIFLSCFYADIPLPPFRYYLCLRDSQARYPATLHPLPSPNAPHPAFHSLIIQIVCASLWPSQTSPLHPSAWTASHTEFLVLSIDATVVSSRFFVRAENGARLDKRWLRRKRLICFGCNWLLKFFRLLLLALICTTTRSSLPTLGDTDTPYQRYL